jgi:two-component system phosphate regulon sensor histidine kinase PhoR
MTIFRKSLVTLGLATLILSSVLIVSVLIFMNSLYYEVNARALSNTASTLFSVFSEERLKDYFTAGSKGRAFPFEDKEYRLTLIDINGDVLWDSQVEQRMVNHLDREEVEAALSGKAGRALRNSASAGTRQLYAALPVFGGEETVAGVFRLSVEVPSFWQRIASSVMSFLFLAAILVFTAFFGIFIYSRSLSHSLIRLSNIVLEDGYENSFPHIDGGEAGELVVLEKALRGMSSDLKLRLGEARTEGRRLEAILDSMSEAVIALDDKLLLLLANPCARKLFNLKDQPENGNTKRSALLEATHSTELEWIARKVLETGEPEETELTFHSGGTERRFQVSVTPLLSESPHAGAAEGIVMVMDDLTRIIRLEQIRKDFVANVSHELRTPIQLMKGFSETILDLPLVSAPEGDSAEREQLRHFIGIIRKNADTMENLISDLLSLASLEDENERRPDAEEQDLVPLFEDALSSVEIQAKNKQIEIIVNCPPDLRAKLHGSYIVQVLVNLLDNAIKYSPNASKVWARAFWEENELVLEVKDQGIGIPAEHLERLFERFYRVDRARSRDAGGTGLGLAIVRHIALLHGGRVEVESHAGEGSTFRVRIPEK